MMSRSIHRFLHNAAVLAAAAMAVAANAHAAGALENPSDGAAVSGIGLVSGWHCTATAISIAIDGGAPVAAAIGTDRLDTAPVCGKRDTGFGLLLNWGLLAPGNHTLAAFADGVQFAQRAITVVSYGTEFLTGKTASAQVVDFPAPGKTTTLAWDENSQSFTTRAVSDGAATLNGVWNGANLEQRSNCTHPENDGAHGTYAQYDVYADSTLASFSVSETAITGLTCLYTGSYQQNGTDRSATGHYSCSDGKTGDFRSTGFVVTPNEMSIRLAIQLNGTETCSVDAILGGSRF